MGYSINLQLFAVATVLSYEMIFNGLFGGQNLVDHI